MAHSRTTYAQLVKEAEADMSNELDSTASVYKQIELVHPVSMGFRSTAMVAAAAVSSPWGSHDVVVLIPCSVT